MATKWRLRDGKWRIYYSEPNAQTLRIKQSELIRIILDNDWDINKNPNGLTPAEQRDAIHALPWVTVAELEKTLPLTGPGLADSIRAIISKHRATNRSDKDKNR